jgi:hypothetical protein
MSMTTGMIKGTSTALAAMAADVSMTTGTITRIRMPTTAMKMCEGAPGAEQEELRFSRDI